mgnify:CR=1 FL=1
MKENNKISDELLIAYIEGNLGEKDALNVEKGINTDNRVFSRYAILNKSYRQIEATEFEVTPDSLKEKLNIILELDANDKVDERIGTRLIDRVDSIVNSIFQLQPRLAIVSAALVAFITRIMFLADPVKPIMLYTDNNASDKQRISELIQSLDNKSSSYLSVKEKQSKGIDISIKDDTLSIKQILKVPRKVYIFNYDKNILLEKEISDKENKIVIKDMIDNDSLRITIETAGIIIYDDWLKMK